MKNLKPITRNNLKTIHGGNAPSDGPWGTCPNGYKQCTAWGACLRESTKCGS